MKPNLRLFQARIFCAVALGIGCPLNPAAAAGATFSDSNWISMNPGIPGASAWISAAVVDGSGNLYIGGGFTVVGDVLANHIAKWDGSSWSALGSGMRGPVHALAVSGSNVYAGFFTTADGSTASSIAKWDGSSWSALGSGIHGGVHALAVSGSDVYAGGQLQTAGGNPVNPVAKWNGSSWVRLGSGMQGGVYALAVSGSDVYAGNTWTAGGYPTNRVAKWNGSIWSALGSGMASPTRSGVGQVSALAVSGSDLYAGGAFTTAGGKISAYIARAYLPNLPALSVLRSGTDVMVSWSSVDTSGFTLEQSGTLAAAVSWIPNTGSVTSDGTNKSVTISPTNGPQFFRLRAQ